MKTITINYYNSFSDILKTIKVIINEDNLKEFCLYEIELIYLNILFEQNNFIHESKNFDIVECASSYIEDYNNTTLFDYTFEEIKNLEGILDILEK